MVIAKNFSVFVKAFEQIHNRPEFSTRESRSFPSFSFDEIKNVSVVSNAVVGTVGGAVVGAALGAAAASGTTSAIIALGKASTGTKIAELHGAAQTKAAIAALGGGAKAAGGGGIALGTVVLNAATLGVATLVEGIALAYASSVAKKEADKAKSVMEENERIINDAIQMQIIIAVSCDDMRVASVKICNGIYKKLVFQLKELVANKNDWNEFSEEEKRMVENCILIVQILHYLINEPMYIVNSCNREGEIDKRLEAGKLMTENQIVKCNITIHTATVAAGASGIIPIPVADAIPMSVTQVVMVVALGKIFGQKLSESAAKGILDAAASTFVGRELIKFIPVMGLIASAGIAAVVTEAVGWIVAVDFAKTYRTEYEREKNAEDAAKAYAEAEYYKESVKHSNELAEDFGEEM